MDDGYDYRVTDYIMEDAFQVNKRRIDSEQKATRERAVNEQTKVYILYVELPGSGGFVDRFMDYEMAKREAIEIHQHYMEAFIEVSCKGIPLLTYPGHLI